MHQKYASENGSCAHWSCLGPDQCDQIGRFIGLWATFESLWQQLIYPNLATFIDIWRFFTGHTDVLENSTDVG